MQAYILSVCGAVILSALVAILLPERKLGKFIQGILRLFCLFVVTMPLFSFVVSWKDGNVKLPETDAQETALDEEFISYVFSRRAEEEEAAWCEYVSEEFGVRASAEVLWDFVDYAYKVTQVKIKIEDFGIYEEDEHIFVIEQIREHISGMISAEVDVYE